MKQNKTIWQEFCCDLVEARKNDILEEPYQNIVEMNLRQLGWSKVQGGDLSKGKNQCRFAQSDRA